MISSTDARAWLQEKGFDPDDLNKTKKFRRSQRPGISWRLTPLNYFCVLGNFTMVQYLVFHRGADCRAVDEYGCCPTFYAACSGHLEIIQFFSQVGGAHEDIRKENGHGQDSPLRIAFLNGHVDVLQYCIRNKALSSPRDAVAGSGIDDATMRRDLGQYKSWDNDKRLLILAWAQDTVTHHEQSTFFLKGTILPSSTFHRHPKNQYPTRSKRRKVSPSSSPLVLFKGKSNILELVATYAGYHTPHELRTFRQLIRLLTAFMKEVPFVPKNNYDDE